METKQNWELTQAMNQALGIFTRYIKRVERSCHFPNGPRKLPTTSKSAMVFWTTDNQSGLSQTVNTSKMTAELEIPLLLSILLSSSNINWKVIALKSEPQFAIKKYAILKKVLIILRPIKNSELEIVIGDYESHNSFIHFHAILWNLTTFFSLSTLLFLPRHFRWDQRHTKCRTDFKFLSISCLWKQTFLNSAESIRYQFVINEKKMKLDQSFF